MQLEAYLALAAHMDELIQHLEQHEEERTRARVVSLLQGIDALHREGLERLMARLRDFGGDELADHVTADPVVELLLGLYDLADLPAPAAPPGRDGFFAAEKLTIRRRSDAEPRGGG